MKEMKTKSVDRVEISDAVIRAEKIINAVKGYLEEMKEKNDNEPSNRMLVAGKVFELDGHLAGAIHCYKQSLALDHENLEAMARLSISLMKAQLNEEALKQAIELYSRSANFTFLSLTSKRSVSSHTVMGDAFRVNNKAASAVGVYKEAWALQKNDRYSAMRYAECLIGEGNLEEGMGILQEVHAEKYGGAALNVVFSRSSMGPLLKDVILESPIFRHEVK